MRNPFAPALLLTIALMAGCVTSPDDVGSGGTSSTAPAPDPTRNTTDPPSASPDGSSPAHKEPTRGKPSGEGPTDPEMTSVLVRFDGRTPARFCPHTSQPLCMTLKAGKNTSVPLQGLSQPLLLQGNLTWNASSHSTGHLTAYVRVDDGQEPVLHQGWIAKAHGESPLRVAFNLRGYGGQRLLLGIINDECLLDAAPAANCALAGTVVAEPAQEYSFAGQVTGWE